MIDGCAWWQEIQKTWAVVRRSEIVRRLTSQRRVTLVNSSMSDDSLWLRRSVWVTLCVCVSVCVCQFESVCMCVSIDMDQVKIDSKEHTYLGASQRSGHTGGVQEVLGLIPEVRSLWSPCPPAPEGRIPLPAWMPLNTVYHATHSLHKDI